MCRKGRIPGEERRFYMTWNIFFSCVSVGEVPKFILCSGESGRDFFAHGNQRTALPSLPFTRISKSHIKSYGTALMVVYLLYLLYFVVSITIAFTGLLYLYQCDLLYPAFFPSGSRSVVRPIPNSPLPGRIIPFMLFLTPF